MTRNPILDRAEKLGYALAYRYLRARAGQSQKQVIFVVGAPRSGTTLLQDRISRHSQLWSVAAETGFFARDNVWRRGPRWKGLRGDAFRQTPWLGGDLVAQFDAFVEAARKISDAGDKTFVEKSPHHVLQLDFLVDRFPEARFVNIVRDPRACYASSKDHENIQQKTPDSFVAYWKRSLDARLKVGAHPNVHDVLYQELVSAPEDTMTGIMAFIGLPFEPDQLGGADAGQDNRVNRKAFAKLGQPINAGSLDKWRQKLTEAEVARVEALVGDYIPATGSRAALTALLDRS